jgi:hypothetical protein
MPTRAKDFLPLRANCQALMQEIQYLFRLCLGNNSGSGQRSAVLISIAQFGLNMNHPNILLPATAYEE